jgi:archaemetzincin
MYKARTGVFSFLRFDPEYLNGYEQEDEKDETKDEGENKLLYNACHVMVHETGHMYGMTHCTHYECTMNGFNSANELELMKKCK